MNHASVIHEKNTDMLTIDDIIAATGGKVTWSNSDAFTGVSIDSRTIKGKEIFIAIKGKNFDGHDFLHEALKRGSGAIVSFPQAEPIKGKTIIQVRDTLKALQDIAHHMRLKSGIPVVGITGSNGKTTTKELIASILSTRYRVLKNIGNLNNHIGLPLSLIRISDSDEIIVLEMGASAPGEIKELCEIAKPNYGVLTNISHAHLEGFQDIETVRKTKLELLGSVLVAMVNADDSFLMEGIFASRFKGEVIRYGIKNDAEIHATDIKLYEKGSTFLLHIDEGKSIEVHPKLSGMFNIYNVLAAASVGHLFEIDLEYIKNAIDSFKAVSMRLEIREQDGIRVISDVYNANPASMEEAIKEIVRLKKGRAIAVLGDMHELGSYGEEAHKRLGRWMSELPIDIFIAVGPLMSLAASEFSGSVYIVQNALEARELFKGICKTGDTVLVKGSRGIGMEKVIADGS
ncbi:MAG: UDP-N-acetylmuramoyl-tripeptide--D-alanyl-D-alanine ligase [Nitrospirota bacterium]|nr:UDP-N-acetylmuramoyl-tripeptide--D-alanyl-D-alanine ligase [Nitrospirota bacterium]